MLPHNSAQQFPTNQEFSLLKTSRNHYDKIALIVATRLNDYVFTTLSATPTQGDHIAVQPISGSGECQLECTYMHAVLTIEPLV